MKVFLHFSNYAAIILLSAIALSPSWRQFYKIASLCWILIPFMSFVYIQNLKEEKNSSGLRMYVIFLFVNFAVWIFFYINHIVPV